jgi:hypothetical protein
VNQPADPNTSSKPPVFWGEIAPCEHIAQFYEHDGVLLDSLVRFVDRGLLRGEGVIVIATREHLRALEESLGAFMFGMATNRLTDTLQLKLTKRSTNSW